jgi:hypothetical protein
VKIVVNENGRPEKVKHPDILRKRFDIPRVEYLMVTSLTKLKKIIFAEPS